MNTSDNAVQPNAPHVPPADVTADNPRPSPFDWAFNTNVRARRIRRRCWVLAAAGVLVALAWGVPAYLDRHVVPRLNPRAADEAELKGKVASALQPGSTRAQTEAWLKSQGLAYSLCDVKGDKVIGIGSERPYSDWLGETGYVSLEFYFDDDGKLTKTYVEVFVYSL
jgi:hypothetical protein